MEYFQPYEPDADHPELVDDLNKGMEVSLLNRIEVNSSYMGEDILDLDAKSMDSQPNFECDVINEYRQLNAGDPEISNLSNRELVLQIGASFEEMGDDVILQIAERDPIFYRFYLSLKEIQQSQN